MNRRLVSVVSILVALGLTACGKSDNPRAHKSPNELGAAGAPGPEASAMADQIFTTRCTPCHGSTGGGDGPASASLNPHPRNFHDKAWQSAVNNEHIEKIIQYGGSAVGKSPNMPANPDLQDKPLVVQALTKKVRGFAGN
jgi:mono/diheme cytochrome c family protein